MDGDDIMRHYKRATEITVQSVISLIFFSWRFKTTAYLDEKEKHMVVQHEITKALPISWNQSSTFKLQTIINSLDVTFRILSNDLQQFEWWSSNRYT